LPHADLRQWIAALERAGELRRIKTEVDPILEIAEITDRVSKGMSGAPSLPSFGKGGNHGSENRPGGPALLFQNVKGHPGSQVLINQFGSESRMKLALGVDSLDEIAGRIRMFMVLSQDSSDRAMQGSHQARQFFTARFSYSAMLAAGCGTIHHASLRGNARSEDR
jgi:UbiD family decarboxylase